MNKAKWDALPADVKKTINEINVEWAKKQGQIWDRIDGVGIRTTLSNGGRIIGIGPKESESWEKAVQPVLQTYLKDTKAKGLPGDQVIKFVQDLRDEALKGTFKSKYLETE
jgi:TRAP-type C4-dicarboxylate transport system substrate-binding protein